MSTENITQQTVDECPQLWTKVYRLPSKLSKLQRELLVRALATGGRVYDPNRCVIDLFGTGNLKWDGWQGKWYDEHQRKHLDLEADEAYRRIARRSQARNSVWRACERLMERGLVETRKSDPHPRTGYIYTSDHLSESGRLAAEALSRLPEFQQKFEELRAKHVESERSLAESMKRLAELGVLKRQTNEYTGTQTSTVTEDQNKWQTNVSVAIQTSTVTNRSQTVDEATHACETTSTVTADLRPTICTDPDRLKKLEQWRRQHTKSVYGSTAGGAK
jgi:predicted transcriptional regulator